MASGIDIDMGPWLDSLSGLKFNSINRFQGDGVTTERAIQFAGGYIDSDHVKAYAVNQHTDVKRVITLTFVTTYRVDTGAVAANERLVIYRDTPSDTPLVNFSDGSVLKEDNLDKATTQAVFVGAETRDWLALVDATTAVTANAEATASAAAAAASEAAAETYSDLALGAAAALGAIAFEEQIVAASSKTTPVDTDLLGLVDSAASNSLKKLTWANVKATLKTYFDTLYSTASSVATAISSAFTAAIGTTVQAYSADTPTQAATTLEMEAGSETELRSMSPAGIAAAIAALVSVGDTFYPGMEAGYWGTTAPSGWVMLSGRTIGSATSGATERANADTETLYTLLWTSLGEAQAPVSGGGRGVGTAHDDFIANKTLQLPDARGRAGLGKDNMGGTTAGRITAVGCGITGTTLGATGGSQSHTLTAAQIAAHSHTETIGTNNGTFPGNPYPNTAVAAGEVTPSYGASALSSTASAGGGEAHNNVGPAYVRNVIIKL
jgi:microcystin-dependent protein